MCVFRLGKERKEGREGGMWEVEFKVLSVPCLSLIHLPLPASLYNYIVTLLFNLCVPPFLLCLSLLLKVRTSLTVSGPPFKVFLTSSDLWPKDAFLMKISSNSLKSTMLFHKSKF